MPLNQRLTGFKLHLVYQIMPQADIDNAVIIAFLRHQRQAKTNSKKRVFLYLLFMQLNECLLSKMNTRFCFIFSPWAIKKFV